MSHRPIARSPDLAQLLADGYNLSVKGGHLVVRDIPYVNTAKLIQRGVLITPLNMTGGVAGTPVDHTMYFAGEYPCDQHGNPLEAIRNNSNTVELAPGLSADHYFSAKPPKGNYDDYHHKFVTYAALISAHAQALDASAVPNPGGFVPASDEGDSVFHYMDTASPRAEIVAITAKLERRKVVIIGLGGTGGYVLDQVAKTPVEEVHLYDGDTFKQHNAFRAPGAASVKDLEQQPEPLKVHYFAQMYGHMRKGIVAHPSYVTAENIDELRDADFVFLCIDDGAAKEMIVRSLEAFDISFIDAGMGIYRQNSALAGILRVTTSTPSRRTHVWENRRISFAKPDDENDYNRNIQVADLNALNAILAVIRWKKLWGFYVDLEREFHSTYTIDGNTIDNEDSE
ncbi:ThiF family adenylyltransferase [Enterobacter sp.]|uniref:ThiF family adenylyltransferase n=1 Tax=Enterobacter sp. TaxID=42895 RepID=UPI0012C7E894|nr:ThiF family adenylyltransferase [Enterobacter sp.]MPS86792.1 ThiF family adenylyltransferase [Enterobacter sp.]